MTNLLTILLTTEAEYTSWEMFSIYKGSGQLNSWDSIGILAGVLLGVGFMIRGTVALFKAVNSPTPGDTLRSLVKIIIGIMAVMIIYTISGAK